MSDSYPNSQKYEHPYSPCSNCGGNCYGTSCLSQNCEYIERASHSRFSQSPVPTNTSYACYSTPQTCRSVSTLFYGNGEYNNPLPTSKVSSCESYLPNGLFEGSRVHYAHL
jgi:hypothetical protein